MVVGVMFGAMLFSALSDRYGRKPVFLFSEWAMVVVGIATAFVTNYYLFSVLRFLAGALQQVGICHLTIPVCQTEEPEVGGIKFDLKLMAATL